MYGHHHGHHSGSNRSYNYNYQNDRSRDKNNRGQRSYQREDNDYRDKRRRDRSSSNQKANQGYRYEKSHFQKSQSIEYQRDRDYENYPEKQMEQTQQKLRIAIRNNQIHFDAKLLQILRGLPLNRQTQIKDQAESAQKIHECILVRQLFISGLQQMNQLFIQQIMKQYGQIQKIQIIRNFAYVKFHRVEDASNACAQYHTINMRIHNMHNPNFKIFFADHVKRWNVVSNSLAYQNIDDIVPVVYASLKNEPPFNTQPFIRQVFEKFGFVRNVELKIPPMKPYKTYALIQYETTVQAIRARDRIKNSREKYLGDRKSEVTLLLDSQKVTRQCPNVKNQLRYQIKRQNNANNQSLMPKTINPYMQQMQHQKPMGNPHVQTHVQSHPHSQSHGQTLSMPQSMHAQPLHPHGQSQSQTQTRPNTDNDNDIFAMIRQFAEKEPQVDPDNEHDESDWVGFLTRKKQFKVQVDFNLIHKVPFQLESILNVSHRGDLQQGITREDYIMAGKFRAANALNQKAFHDYINYFIKKNRAGIIQSKNYLIYLLPPMEKLPYPIKPDELLALFFKL